MLQIVHNFRKKPSFFTSSPSIFQLFYGQMAEILRGFFSVLTMDKKRWHTYNMYDMGSETALSTK